MLVIDLEATCCDKESIPSTDFETIEIGAVIVTCKGIIDSFQSFVRPNIHPKLTDFCVSFTHISQRDVDTAPAFYEIFPTLLSWIKMHKHSKFYSWGRFDQQQFNRDCKRYGMVNPLKHQNLAGVTKKSLGIRSQSRLLRKFGIERVGTHHRGIDDAITLGKAGKELILLGIIPEVE